MLQEQVPDFIGERRNLNILIRKKSSVDVWERSQVFVQIRITLVFRLVEDPKQVNQSIPHVLCLVGCKIKEASERLNSYLNSLDDNKKILEMAHFEFSKKYLTNDSMEVLAAYHDADIVVKNVIRKVLDLPSLEEKKESSAS